MRRQMLIVAAALAALLLSAQAALAGGWAVLTFDALPSEVRAGESFQLGFTVRQHGQTLVNNDWDGNPLKPVVSAKLAGAAQGLTFEARQEGPTGHFVVDVTLPEAGSWVWSIAVPPFALPSDGQFADTAYFAPLTVLPALAQAQPAEPVTVQAQPAPAAPPTSAPLAPKTAWLPWAGGALLLALAALLLMQRGRGVAREQA